MVFPSVTSWLDGTFQNRTEPSTVYLVRLKNHPSFFKLGFCQVRLRKMRYGDPEYGSIEWESCRDEDLTKIVGDISRGDCWLFEQYLHERLLAQIEQVPSLAQRKWPGYQETIRCEEAKKKGLIEFIRKEAISILTSGFSGLERCLDELAINEQEKNLYQQRQAEWSKMPGYNGILSKDPIDLVEIEARKFKEKILSERKEKYANKKKKSLRHKIFKRTINPFGIDVYDYLQQTNVVIWDMQDTALIYSSIVQDLKERNLPEHKAFEICENLDINVSWLKNKPNF